ncbi:tape measure protein [Flavobacterium covae]
MSSTVEFVVRMRDMMSEGLNRLATTSQSAFSRMNQQAQQFTGRNRILAQSYSEIQKRIQEVETTIRNSTSVSQIREARRELALLQRQANNHSSGLGSGGDKKGIGIGGIALGSMVGGVATQAMGAIAGAVSSGVGAMIQGSMEKEQAITGLKTFLGEKGANDAYANIRKDAAVTPFDTASLLEVNRSLISAGTNAQDARKDTMNLANAVAAVGGGNDVLSRMAANMQQIKTVGKATATDIKQFGMAGINIYEMLSKSTGKSIAQVREMDVSYTDLSKALEMARAKGGIYAGALEAQGQTKAGKWSTFKDNLSKAATDIGDAFSPVMNKLLDLAVRFSNSIAPAIQKAQPYIDMMANGVGKAVDWIMSLVNGTSKWSDWVTIVRDIFKVVVDHAQNMLAKIWHIVQGVIEFIKKSELLKDIFRFLGWLLEKTFGIIGKMADALVWLWDKLILPFFEKVEWAYKMIKDLWSDDEKHIKVTATKKLLLAKAKDEPIKDSPLITGGKLAQENSSSGKSAGESVSGGGPKTINIYVEKYADGLNFYTMNAQETAEQIYKIVSEFLGRTLIDTSKVI